MSLFSRLLRLHSSAMPLENFFTEVVGRLFQLHPELCLQWLENSGVSVRVSDQSSVSVSTQIKLTALEEHSMGSRPDMEIYLHTSDGEPQVILIESKIDSKEGVDQLRRYADHLGGMEGFRQKTLLYITRDYDPKDELEILANVDERVEFRQARWSSLYQSLVQYQRQLAKQDKRSDLIDEVTDFMGEYKMSQQNRLSTSDVSAMVSMLRVLSFMRETLAGEVEAKIRELTTHKTAGRYQTLRRLEDQERYYLYALMHSGFWCGAGFYLGTEHPDDYPWLSVTLEVGPEHPQREKILRAMRSFDLVGDEAGSYGLDDPNAWSGIEWSLNLGEILGEEDHMDATRKILLDNLDEVQRFREEYPDLPWGQDG